MKLGLFPGTFDPIHLGHLILAEECREACGLDRVCFLVARSTPHKPGCRTAFADRLEMVRIAVADHTAFEGLGARSARRRRDPGGDHSLPLRRRVLLPVGRRWSGRPLSRAGDRPHRAAGGDYVSGGAARLGTVVVVNRPGFDVPRIDLAPDARPVRTVTGPPIGISSTEVRRRLAEGRSIRYLVPQDVEAYIEANGLYW